MLHIKTYLLEMLCRIPMYDNCFCKPLVINVLQTGEHFLHLINVSLIIITHRVRNKNETHIFVHNLVEFEWLKENNTFTNLLLEQHVKVVT